MPLHKKEEDRSNKQEHLIIETDDERRLRDIYRPDMEKLTLFTQMLRTNALLKKAKITHR